MRKAVLATGLVAVMATAVFAYVNLRVSFYGKCQVYAKRPSSAATLVTLYYQWHDGRSWRTFRSTGEIKSANAGDGSLQHSVQAPSYVKNRPLRVRAAWHNYSFSYYKLETSNEVWWYQ